MPPCELAFLLDQCAEARELYQDDKTVAPAGNLLSTARMDTDLCRAF